MVRGNQSYPDQNALLSILFCMIDEDHREFKEHICNSGRSRRWGELKLKNKFRDKVLVPAATDVVR